MKYIIIITALLFSAITFAQNKEPVFEKDGKLVKGTYYFENGQVSQFGTYKKGKLHGEWISYNEEGNKVASGNYENGSKTGTWFFWNGKELSEVNYSKNEISSIKTHEDDSYVVMDFKRK